MLGKNYTNSYTNYFYANGQAQGEHSWDEVQFVASTQSHRAGYDGTSYGTLAELTQTATPYLSPWADRQTDALRTQQLQAHEHRQFAQQMQADNRTIIDQLGEHYGAHYGITDEHLSALLQQSENGDFDLAFQGIEGLTDQDGHVAYGAYDRESGSILLNQDLINRAQSGDQQAAAHLRAVMLEEQTHAIADSLQTLLGIDDLTFDEGALVARSMLGDLAQQGQDTQFSLGFTGADGNLNHMNLQFSAEAAGQVRDEHFGLARILADHQSTDGALQYASSAATHLSRELDQVVQQMESFQDATFH